MAEGMETIGTRIRDLRGTQTQAEFATQLMVSKNTIGMYERGERRPEAEVLARMHEVLGVDINWLLTGSGRMRRDEEPVKAAEPATDARLIGRLTEGISRVFAETGQAAALHQIAERAARYHDRIVATVADPDDRLVEAGSVLAELRAELRAAATNPHETKRLA